VARKSVEAELAVAKAIAVQAGLGTIAPELLKLAKHTTVRLAPLPIVARIQSNEPIDRSYANASRELAVAGQLASRGAPAVRPTSPVDPGPYIEAGCVITLWEFVDGRTVRSDADAIIAARALKEVHHTLALIDADLPSFAAALDSCETILTDAELPAQSSDRLFLQRIYADLREELGRRELVCRQLHGDTHLGNVLITDAGALWMDLEAACTGPIEWDAVTLPSSTWPEFEDIAPDLMRLLKDLRRLSVTAWCWADLDRSAEVAEAAAHHLEALKARFD
jgi:thiamine kinase-like enzyme